MSASRKSPEAPEEALSSRTRDGEEGFGSRVAGVLLLAACALGLLRFMRLGEWSLWIDEALTVADFQNRLGEGSVINQAGYYLIAKVSAFFDPPNDAFALRFLPALAGWLHLPALWFLWRRPLGPLRSGAAALLLAVSPWHLYWSQNARFYTLASLLAFVGISLLLRVFFDPEDEENPRKPARVVFVGLFGFGLTVAAILFHPSTVLGVGAIVLTPWIVWLLTKTPIRGLRAQGPARRVALTLLFLSFVGALIAVPRLRTTFEEYSYHKSTPSPAAFLLTTGYYLHPAVCAAVAVGGVLAWRRKNPFTLALLVFLLLCGAVAFGASLQARIVAQYVFFTLPFAMLLATSLLRTSRVAVETALYGALFAALLAGSLLYMTRYRGERPRWRDAYEWVYERAESEDMIVGMAAPVGEFYISPSTPDYRRPERVTWIDSYRPRRMQETARFEKRMWIVVHPDWFGDWEEEHAEDARAFLREQCRMVQDFPLPVGTRDLGIQVFLRE